MLIAVVSCTKDFESTNQNPNQISDQLLKQDFNLVGSPFSGLLFNLSDTKLKRIFVMILGWGI